MGVSIIIIGRKRKRQEIALHHLQAEFMWDAPTDEWVELPGGTQEGLRLPDYDDGNIKFVGNWLARPKDSLA